MNVRSIPAGLALLLATSCHAARPAVMSGASDDEAASSRGRPIELEPACASSPCERPRVEAATFDALVAAVGRVTEADAASALERLADDASGGSDIGVALLRTDTWERIGCEAAFVPTFRGPTGYVAITEPLGWYCMDRIRSEYVRLHEVSFGTYTRPSDGRPAPYAVLSYERGVSGAEGCDLRTHAEQRALVCFFPDRVPHCVGSLRLGPADYAEDNLLPTPMEAMGECDDVAPAAVEPETDEPDCSVDTETPGELRIVCDDPSASTTVSVPGTFCGLPDAEAVCARRPLR